MTFWSKLKWRLTKPPPCPMCGETLCRSLTHVPGYYCIGGGDSGSMHYDINENDEFFRLREEYVDGCFVYWSLLIPRAEEEAHLVKTVWGSRPVFSRNPSLHHTGFAELGGQDFAVPKASVANFDPKHPEELVKRIETLIAFS